jgi:hypothetical protein
MMFVSCLAQSLPAAAGENRFDGDASNIDSIGLSLTLPFGGSVSGQNWLQRAEPSLNLGMNRYEPNWQPCEESCQQRPYAPRAYSLSIVGLLEAASELAGPEQDLRLQPGRWRELLIDSPILPEADR